MKLFFLIMTVVVAASALTPKEENQLFEKYISDFNVRIGRSDNVEERKQRFIQNYNNVQAHNAANLSYTMNINRFAHLSEAELAMRTGYIDHPQDHTNGQEYTPGRNGRSAPEQHDWRNTPGVVRPVQNQGSCGSCWAFGAIGALEGQMTLKKSNNVKLSEQEIIECATSNGVLRACNGGWDALAYQQAKNFYGVTSANLNPYVATVYRRTCSSGRTKASGSAIITWNYISGSEEAVREALYNNGPLYVTYRVADNFYQYRSGIYSDPGNQCGTKVVNHAVLLVGYGIENGIPFWLLKNSWGTGWGERGYFRMRRGVKLCRFSGASFPVLA